MGCVSVASFPVEISRSHGTIASSRRDRALGAVCLVGCPAISGLFLGLVAVLCTHATGGGRAIFIGSVVAGIAFAANALAICLTASAAHSHAVRQQDRIERDACESFSPSRRTSGGWW